jgi:hypothetical protein
VLKIAIVVAEPGPPAFEVGIDEVRQRPHDHGRAEHADGLAG